MFFPFDNKFRAAIGPQRSGAVEVGRRQATFQRVVLLDGTKRQQKPLKIVRQLWNRRVASVSSFTHCLLRIDRRP
jgi:hypothetical protein